MADIVINGGASDVVRIIVILTIITIAPFMLLMMTCFTRIIIVLGFLRHAMGLQQTPPTQVLIGLALFLTFFIMSPVLSEINETALQPYNEREIETAEFLERAAVPAKEFMLAQTGTDELDFFRGLSREPGTAELSVTRLPLSIVVPAFMISELKRAFIFGFLMFIPFLVIDTIVASTLMSMGMIMLPPVMISMPFKILLFVVVDGWGLLVNNLIMSFN
ncbi:MAG: flagellar type III secretion system pore protein FliP [Clostridiales Family XIII bacterium]|jgi:flagellar biosynthetic protein FliP|nr:flagellar type III secretion system pore protein FliP [Clostridiales Family XIII bacterium]